jgi:peptide/nickel transport system permease protein
MAGTGTRQERDSGAFGRTDSGDSLLARAGRTIVARAGLAAGLIGLSIIVAIAIFAPLLSPHDPYAQDVLTRRLPPIWDAWFNENSKASPLHPFGTDNLGRDYWARLAAGTRISLAVGFGSALIAIFIGSSIGIAAGYFGGKIDLAANFIIQTRLSIPVILVAMLAVATFGGSLLLIILICGLFLWDRAAVVSRAVAKQIAAQEYITAGKALGASDLRIILTEVVPNAMTPLVVVLTVEMGQAILFEAALSFLGLGMPPPTPSWGLMLSEAKGDIFFAPSTIAIPGIALFLLVLSTSLIGDGLQDDRTRGAP